MKNPKKKWRFGIGTTSRVPQSAMNFQYLIADFDDNNFQPIIDFINSEVNNAILQRTKNGWHVYTDYKILFPALVEKLKTLGADPAWIRIGEKRGYFFLADKQEINFPWPVEHMVIHYGKKKA